MKNSSYRRWSAKHKQMVDNAHTSEQLIAVHMYDNIMALSEFRRDQAARYRSLMAILQSGRASLEEVHEALKMLVEALAHVECSNF